MRGEYLEGLRNEDAMPQSSWDADAGLVTRAFDDWRLAERELRAFLRVGLEFSAEGYGARWERLSRQPSDGEGPELIDLMDAEVEGLSSLQFDWLLMNLVVCDGVTLYEVYLEKALHEVGSRVGATVVGEKAPFRSQIKAIYPAAFGENPAPDDVKAVMALRDLLTHRRGELCTDALRDRYDTAEYDLPDLSVRLTPEIVTDHLDTLSTSVDRIERVLFPLAWGRESLAQDIRDRLIRDARWLFER